MMVFCKIVCITNNADEHKMKTVNSNNNNNNNNKTSSIINVVCNHKTFAGN